MKNAIYRGTAKRNFKSFVSALLAVLLLAVSVSTQTAPPNRSPNPRASHDHEIRVEVRDVGPELGKNNSLEGFLINPQNPRQLLASTQENGISKSRDGGQTWFRSNNGLTDQRGLNPNANGIRKDPGHPLGVFAATFGQGLYHSTDFGDTWTPVGVWTSFSAPFGSAFLVDCAINPASPNIVFALSTYSDFALSGGSGGYTPLFKSTDGGSTFVPQLGTGLPEGGAFTSMAIPQTNPDVIYVTVEGGYTEEGPAEGVYKSTDGGANFVFLDSSPPRPLQVFPHPTLADTIYLQAFGLGPTGLFRSTDGGATFLQVTAGLPADRFNYFAAFDHANPSYVYVAGEGGLFRSTDGGSTFAALGLTQEQLGLAAITLTIDPTNSDLIYVNTNEGNFRSVNGGRTFVSINRGWQVSGVNFLTFDNHARPNLYVAARSLDPLNGKLLKTGSRGKHYDSIGSTSAVTSMAVGGNNSELIVIATNFDGIFRSIDGGQSWTAATLDTGQKVFVTSRVAIDPTNPSNVYLTSGSFFSGGFYRSVDGGQTFSRTYSGGFRFGPKALAIDPLNPSVIYAGEFLGPTLLKSTNGGLGFTTTQLGPRFVSRIVDIVLNPQDSRIVYVAGQRLTSSTNRSVVRSTDGGATFMPADNGLVGSVIGIAIDPLDLSRLFAWMVGGGLFMTEDSGDHWTLIEGGEALRRSGFGRSMTINPKKPNRIYLGGASVLEVKVKSGDDDEDDDN